MENVRACVVIYGRVQGVFFRAAAVEQALRLSLRGWVKNCSGGFVKAVFEGGEDKVSQMIDWCHHGPAGAHVKQVDVEWGKYTGEFDNFRIRW